MGKGEDTIKAFLRRIKKLDPELVLLFGSRAAGKNMENSDYDIAIISRIFEGMHPLKRMELLYSFWDFETRADLLAYTPEEFEKLKKRIGIVREIARKGKVIYRKRAGGRI